MHKLIEYVCDELEELERKADKGGKLSTSEIQYADMLAHLKKNLLTSDAMMDADEYSNEGGNSYARGRRGNVKRDSMGRYSRLYDEYSREDAKEDVIMQLREMERNADEESKHMIRKWIKQVEEQ